MSFEALRRSVERAERRVETRLEATQAHRARLGEEWRSAWTPGRILAVGLIGGMLAARTRPLRVLGGISATKWMQLATSLSGLFASLKAAYAAQTAEAAADEADAAAGSAASTAPPAPAPETSPGDHQSGRIRLRQYPL